MQNSQWRLRPFISYLCANCSSLCARGSTPFSSFSSVSSSSTKIFALVHEPHQTVELILLHHVAHVHPHRHVGIALLRVATLC